MSKDLLSTAYSFVEAAQSITLTVIMQNATPPAQLHRSQSTTLTQLQSSPSLG
jgi:hypothetical protein